jgi:hypothetical protein
MLLAACTGTTDGPVPLTVTGTGFPDGDAQVAVLRLPELDAVACDTTIVVGGSFELEIGDILEATVAYRIDTFVDVDGDQRCEPGVDAVGTLLLPARMPATSPLVIDVPDDAAACASFESVCAP